MDNGATTVFFILFFLDHRLDSLDWLRRELNKSTNQSLTLCLEQHMVTNDIGRYQMSVRSSVA